MSQSSFAWRAGRELLNRTGVLKRLPVAYRHQLWGWGRTHVFTEAFERHKAIFIHVPKTAGTSVSRTLFGGSSEHVPHFVYRRADPDRFRSYFKFTFVRNPFDRVVSAYYFLRNNDISEPDRLWAEKNVTPFDNFQHFVRDGLKTAMRDHIAFMPHSYFLLDGNGRCAMDFVGRFESLQRDFQTVARTLGMRGEPTLPHLNLSKHPRYSECFDADSRDLVTRAFANDIRHFGYRFGED